MRRLIIPMLLLLANIVFAQQREAEEVPQEILSAIQKDVWIPFMEAYQQSDSKKLKSIHAQDIIRVTKDNNRIETGASYLERFGGFVESVQKRGRKMEIAFALLSTAINGEETLAYQTGYYRFSSKTADDEDFVIRGYGKFDVCLKRINGQWKLWLDADTGANISDADFNAHEVIYTLKS